MGRTGRLELVSYDLDGTLIDGTAFLLVARRLGIEKEILHHDARFRAGEISLEECFEIEFALLAGTRVSEVEAALEEGTWFPGIHKAITSLHEAGLDTLVLTDNPDFIAHYTKRFGIPKQLCSPAETQNGVITGKVRPRFDKWAGLKEHLEHEGIDPARVAHVGNDINDIRVWDHIGLGVCVEPTTPKVAEAADIVIEKTDHQEIARVILEWHDSG
jgi:HAD superfamily phosphoserine phosphatase-like hydrolase